MRPPATFSRPTSTEIAAGSRCLQYLLCHAAAILSDAGDDDELKNLVALAERLPARLKAARKAAARAVAAAAAEPVGADASAAGDVGAATETPLADDVVQIAQPHLSRPLYPNPVCLLTTWARGRVNVMTISWLAPLDNDGRFTLSLNARRFTARMLVANPVLTLSVATAGMEDLLKRVGGCSGRSMDKSRRLGIALCRPGWGQVTSAARLGEEEGQVLEAEDPSRVAQSDDEWRCWPDDCEQQPEVGAGAYDGSVAISAGVAHIVACVRLVRPRHGHLILECETTAAFVRGQYWSGKTFEPQQPNLPPILSFLGSQRFGHVTPAPAQRQAVEEEASV